MPGFRHALHTRTSAWRNDCVRRRRLRRLFPLSRSQPEDARMTDISCPLPITDYPNVLLAHGGGGRLMHEMLMRRVLPALGTPDAGQTDAALLEVGSARLAFTTDAY